MCRQSSNGLCVIGQLLWRWHRTSFARGAWFRSPVLLVLSVLTPPLATPSSSSRLVGFDSESKELNADVLRKYIFGGHVADYMRVLEEEDEEKYKSHFAKYIEKGITADKVGGWSMACSQLLQ